MPRDSAGQYILPDGYLAVTGEKIKAAQHNAPLEDLAAAVSASLPRAGTAGMTGPLMLMDGDTTRPGIGFISSPGNGLVRTPSGIAIVVSGSIVAEFTANGLIGLPVGTPIPVLDDTLPPLCVWADGRNLFRSTYAALYTKWGVRYGEGNGSTTFGIPDFRGRSLIGRDNTGGTDAERLAGVPATTGSRIVTGSVLGSALTTLTIDQMPAHNHPGSTVSTVTDHTHALPEFVAVAGGAGFGALVAATVNTVQSGGAGSHTHSNDIAQQGGGLGHNTVQPSVVCNWAIYAGA